MWYDSKILNFWGDDNICYRWKNPYHENGLCAKLFKILYKLYIWNIINSKWLSGLFYKPPYYKSETKSNSQFTQHIVTSKKKNCVT